MDPVRVAPEGSGIREAPAIGAAGGMVRRDTFMSTGAIDSLFMRERWGMEARKARIRNAFQVVLSVNLVGLCFIFVGFVLHRTALKVWINVDSVPLRFECSGLHKNEPLALPKGYLELSLAYFWSVVYACFLGAIFMDRVNRVFTAILVPTITLSAVILTFAVLTTKKVLRGSGWNILLAGFATGFALIVGPDLMLLFGKAAIKPTKRRKVPLKLVLVFVKATIMLIFGANASLYAIASERFSGLADVALNGRWFGRFSFV